MGNGWREIAGNQIKDGDNNALLSPMVVTGYCRVHLNSILDVLLRIFW